MLAPTPSLVQDIHTVDEFNNAITAAGTKLVIIDFSATWCGPCKAIAPVFAQLSHKYPNIVFLKVDVDEITQIADAAGVRGVPTFVFMKNAVKVESFSGADGNKLETTIHKYNVTTTTSNTGGFTIPGGQRDLTEFIVKSSVSCLNQDDSTPVKNVFQDEGHLASDSDAQILIYFPFQNTIKLHSIKIDALDDGSAPKTIKLFVNNTSLNLNLADRERATQEIVLTAKDINAVIPVKFISFQNVNTLTLFVKDNFGNKDKTIIQRIIFIGQTRETTNMDNFSKATGKVNHAV